jgi:hypothetical protein
MFGGKKERFQNFQTREEQHTCAWATKYSNKVPDSDGYNEVNKYQCTQTKHRQSQCKKLYACITSNCSFSLFCYATKHYNKEIHVFTVGSSLIITVSSLTTFKGLGRIHLCSEHVLVPLHKQHPSRHCSEHDFS